MKSIFTLIIILSLSGFTHLWNPIGFPDIFYDEGIYMRRAMHVLEGQGPQESATFYDHPYFGQLFLAGIFKIIGYPNSLNPVADLHSIEMLYVIPRLLMGVLAVIDTFLIYKISEYRYGKNVALVASILFAVMPASWFTRRILLDSILLPFILSSILLAIYSTNRTKFVDHTNKQIRNNIPLVLLSGICLGLAIFTKIPSFVNIPLISFLIFVNNKRNWKTVGIWFVPVILIPLIWPAYSLLAGQFNNWESTVHYQLERQGAPFLKTVALLVKIDPVLMVLAMAAIGFAALKKDMFILLWAIPIFLFFFFIEWEWAPYQLFIPQIPLYCISAAVLLVKIIKWIRYKSVQKAISYTLPCAIGLFGLVSTTILITTNVTATQFQTLEFVSHYLGNMTNKGDDITIVSNPAYSWIFKYVYGRDHVLNEFNNFGHEAMKTKKILFISDAESESFNRNTNQLRVLYENSTQLFKISGPINNFDINKYPYTSLEDVNFEGLYDIEVRIVR